MHKQSSQALHKLEFMADMQRPTPESLVKAAPRCRCVQVAVSRNEMAGAALLHS